MPMRKPVQAPIPRPRRSGGLALLAQGLRPFFLLAGLWAPIGHGLSLAMMSRATLGHSGRNLHAGAGRP